MTKRGLRTLAFCYRDFTCEQFEAIVQDSDNFTAPASIAYLESESTFLALVALKDPLREHVQKCVNLHEKGSVNICLVTNNSLETSKKIAVEAGIMEASILDKSDSMQSQFAMHASDFRAFVGGLTTSYDEN